MYFHYMSFATFARVVISTWMFKVLTAIIVAYLATIIVHFLKKVENINQPEFFHNLSFNEEEK